jgi:heme/copper-type cytochrome/quinol oxidase subunit 4
MEHHSEQDDFKRDILIYFSIIALVGVIIFISHLQLKTLGIFFIVPIACVEAGILGYYFMHLMTKKKTVHLILLLTVIVFLSLLFWPAWDIAYSPRTPSEFTVY